MMTIDWDNDDIVDCAGDTLQEPQEPSTPPPTPPMLELPDEGNGMPRALFIPLKMVPFIHPSKSMKEAIFNFDLINLGFKIFEVIACEITVCVNIVVIIMGTIVTTTVTMIITKIEISCHMLVFK